MDSDQLMDLQTAIKCEMGFKCAAYSYYLNEFWEVCFQTATRTKVCEYAENTASESVEEILKSTIRKK